MQDLLQSLVKRIETQRMKRDERAERHSHAFRCRCGNDIFFSPDLPHAVIPFLEAPSLDPPAPMGQ